MAKVVEHLLSECKALSSNPRTAKKRKKKKEEEKAKTLTLYAILLPATNV
jgi:hypothetical protein